MSEEGNDFSGLRTLIAGPVSDGHVIYLGGEWYIWEGGKKGGYVPYDPSENQAH